ncbi:protein of unknown function [Paraburkholderia dioscoreae]|uniref:Uncharacterized protein n=1 Tax=Paraburkholderia dioscoreae TaxID=2604047 RepID=A0A5Q4YTL8_9BURK|nr:protein of unknown function [Paraburkholderia dioscoreae]
MEVSRRGFADTLELREALTGDATNEARQIFATLTGPIELEQREGAHFAPYDDISERLLVCAAGNVSFVLVAGVGFEPTTFGL